MAMELTQGTYHEPETYRGKKLINVRVCVFLFNLQNNVISRYSYDPHFTDGETETGWLTFSVTQRL